MRMNSSELRVLFRASDFDASVRFYQELLGMERLKNWERDTGSGVILRAGPGRTIELLGAPPGQGYADERLPRGVTLWLQVDDVAEWYERLRASGAVIARELADDPWGTRSFRLDDPDGTQVWLFEGTDTG